MNVFAADTPRQAYALHTSNLDL